VRRLSWRLPEHVRFCLLAFIAGRVATSGIAVVAWHLSQAEPEPTTRWKAQVPSNAWANAFAGFERFDAQWYLQLARDGYVDGDPSAAFFPLYPLLIRGLGTLLGDRWLLAATLVSNAALIVALVLVYRLTTLVLSASAARWTVVLLLLHPMALFLYAPYAESLFLMLAAACLLWLREGRWVPAALAASLATATRSSGVVLCFAMAATALHEAGWWPAHAAAWKRLLARCGPVALSATGLLAYLAFWAAKGDWNAPLTTQRTAFFREPSWPWTAVLEGVQDLIGSVTEHGALLMNGLAVLTVLTLLLTPRAVRRYGATNGAYVLGSIVMPLCLVRPYAPLTSVPRYYLVAFPVIWALVELTRRPAWRVVTVIVSGGALAVLTLLFARWHDVL